MNVSEEIKRLHELHQAGALTDAEFEQAKAKLLKADPVNLNKPGDPGPGPRPGNGDLSSEIGALRRARADRWLGGVCGGLGKVSGVESWIWRLVFVAATLFTFFTIGLLIYVLMWIFIPEE